MFRYVEVPRCESYSLAETPNRCGEEVYLVFVGRPNPMVTVGYCEEHYNQRVRTGAFSDDLWVVFDPYEVNADESWTLLNEYQLQHARRALAGNGYH